MTTQLNLINLERTYTIAEYMALPDNGQKYELVEGKLVEMPGPSVRHGSVITKLAKHLDNFLDNQPLGAILTDTAFVLDSANNTIRRPDIAFVEASRMVGVDYNEAFSGPPALAIEVLSPTDVWSEVVDKVHEYQAAGVQMVWVVDPFDRALNIYRPGQPRQSLTESDEVSGENLLPGFRLLVVRLFE